MTAAKHTPGPWEAHGGVVVASNNGRVYDREIARVGVPLNKDDNRVDELLANARLIAGAPKLLELVRISIGNIRSRGPAGALAQVYMPYKEWLRQLEEAYAEATGSAA